MQTRREFLLTSAMCTFVVAGASPILAAPSSIDAASIGGAPLLEADPYTCHLDDGGLGGRSWDAAFHHALRFRSTPEDRDRYVLGLEV